MAIVESELKVFKAEINDDSASNGGVMSAVEAVDNASDIWPSVGLTERTAGSVKYRKTFHKNNNAADTILQNTLAGLWSPTPGDDAMYLISADQSNNQGSLTGSEPLYGVGTLNAPAAATDTVITVLVEDGANIIFRDGEKIRISDQTDPADEIGNEEFNTINGVPAVLGDVVTITLLTGLLSSYSSTATNVASMIDGGDLTPVTTTPVVTSAAGVPDETGLGLHNLGTIQESWAITFTSGTSYDLVGAVKGALGSGNTAADFEPLNPDTGTPYLTVGSAFWTGTWLLGDTVTFTTSPSAVPVFEKRVIPAGAASSAANSRRILLWGESA